MWIIKFVLMFLLRQVRWVVAIIAIGGATLIFRLLQGREEILLPGMEQPYELGSVEPYIAAAVVYLLISRTLKKFTARFLTEVSEGFDRLRSGD
jgi:hypothetical protein